MTDEIPVSRSTSGRFIWWPPWTTLQPWKPAVFRGADEWHNRSVAVKVPLLGTFIFFHGSVSREGEEHLYGYNPKEGLLGRDVPGCPVCAEVLEDLFPG